MNIVFVLVNDFKQPYIVHNSANANSPTIIVLNNPQINFLSSIGAPAACNTDEVVAGFPVLAAAAGFPVVTVDPDPAPPTILAAPELPGETPGEAEVPGEVAPGVVFTNEFVTGQVVVYRALVEATTWPIEQPLGGTGQDVMVLVIVVKAVNVVNVGVNDVFPYEL